MRSLPARGSTPRSPAGPRCADSSWRLFGGKLFAPCAARAQRMQQLKFVVVARSNDQPVALRAPQRRQPASLSLDRNSAYLHFDGQKTTASVAAKQEAVAGVVAPPDRHDAIEVPREEQIDVAVAVDVLCKDGLDRSELSLHGQGLEPENTLPVVQRNGACKHLRFAHLCPFQLLRGHDLLDAARDEARIRWVPGAKLRHHSHELVAPRKRIAHAIPEKRHDLLERAVVEEIVDIHPCRLVVGGSYVGVQSQVAEHQIVSAVTIEIGGGDRIPPPARS